MGGCGVHDDKTHRGSHSGGQSVTFGFAELAEALQLDRERLLLRNLLQPH